MAFIAIWALNTLLSVPLDPLNLSTERYFSCSVLTGTCNMKNKSRGSRGRTPFFHKVVESVLQINTLIACLIASRVRSCRPVYSQITSPRKKFPRANRPKPAAGIEDVLTSNRFGSQESQQIKYNSKHGESGMTRHRGDATYIWLHIAR